MIKTYCEYCASVRGKLQPTDDTGTCPKHSTFPSGYFVSAAGLKRELEYRIKEEKRKIANKEHAVSVWECVLAALNEDINAD